MLLLLLPVLGDPSLAPTKVSQLYDVLRSHDNLMGQRNS